MGNDSLTIWRIWAMRCNVVIKYLLSFYLAFASTLAPVPCTAVIISSACWNADFMKMSTRVDNSGSIKWIVLGTLNNLFINLLNWTTKDLFASASVREVSSSGDTKSSRKVWTYAQRPKSLWTPEIDLSTVFSSIIPENFWRLSRAHRYHKETSLDHMKPSARRESYPLYLLSNQRSLPCFKSIA